MKVKLDIIRELRTKKGFSQENIAHELGLTQPQYGRLENGENEFDFAKLTKLFDVLQVSPFDIIEFEEKHIFINSYNNVGSNSANTNSTITTTLSKDDLILIIRKEIKIALDNFKSE